MNSAKIVKIVTWSLIWLGMILRFITPFIHHPLNSLWSDPGRHWSHATDPLSFNPMGAFDPIMYQVWLGIMANITFGNPLAVAIFVALLSVATPFCWYLFFKEIFPEESLFALLGLLLITWLPSWIGIYSYFMNETLLLPLLGLALYFTWRAIQEKTTKSFIKVSVAWLLTALTKAIALPLAIVAVVYLIASQKQKKLKIALLAALSLALLAPPAFRTYNIVGVWAPFGYAKPHQLYMRSGAQEANYQILKSPNQVFGWGLAMASCYKNPFEPFYKWPQQRHGKLKVLVDADLGNIDWEVASKQTELPLSAKLNLWFENLVFFFFAQPWPDGNLKHFWENLNVTMRWLWLPAFLLAFACNLIYFFKQHKFELLPSLNIIGWLACVACLDVGESRYHKPLEGLLIANLLWLACNFKNAYKTKQAKLEQKAI
jgi:hypothetical protein